MTNSEAQTASMGFDFSPDADGDDQGREYLVGGQLITPSARYINEDSSLAGHKRAWLAAMSNAFFDRSSDQIKKLSNVRDIAQQAIKKGFLSDAEVNQKLNELRINPAHLELEIQTQPVINITPETQVENFPPWINEINSTVDYGVYFHRTNSDLASGYLNTGFPAGSNLSAVTTTSDGSPTLAYQDFQRMHKGLSTVLIIRIPRRLLNEVTANKNVHTTAVLEEKKPNAGFDFEDDLPTDISELLLDRYSVRGEIFIPREWIFGYADQKTLELTKNPYYDEDLKDPPSQSNDRPRTFPPNVEERTPILEINSWEEEYFPQVCDFLKSMTPAYFGGRSIFIKFGNEREVISYFDKASNRTVLVFDFVKFAYEIAQLMVKLPTDKLTELIEGIPGAQNSSDLLLLINTFVGEELRTQQRGPAITAISQFIKTHPSDEVDKIIKRNVRDLYEKKGEHERSHAMFHEHLEHIDVPDLDYTPTKEEQSIYINLRKQFNKSVYGSPNLFADFLFRRVNPYDLSVQFINQINLSTLSPKAKNYYIACSYFYFFDELMAVLSGYSYHRSRRYSDLVDLLRTMYESPTYSRLLKVISQEEVLAKLDDKNPFSLIKELLRTYCTVDAFKSYCSQWLHPLAD